MVPPWCRGDNFKGVGGSSNRGRIHDRTALSSSRSNGWGRHGGGKGREGWNCSCGGGVMKAGTTVAATAGGGEERRTLGL